MYVMMTDFGGYNMDVTTYTMLLMTKLWGLTFAYKDGAEPVEKLTKDQVERRVVQMPTLIQYFSYVFFCCGCLMGPFFEFADFVNWIQFTGNYKKLPRGLKNGWATLIPALRRTFDGFLCLGIHLYFILGLGFSSSFVGLPEYATCGGFAYRMFYQFMAMTG